MKLFSYGWYLHGNRSLNTGYRKKNSLVFYTVRRIDEKNLLNLIQFGVYTHIRRHGFVFISCIDLFPFKFLFIHVTHKLFLFVSFLSVLWMCARVDVCIHACMHAIWKVVKFIQNVFVFSFFVICLTNNKKKREREKKTTKNRNGFFFDSLFESNIS